MNILTTMVYLCMWGIALEAVWCKMWTRRWDTPWSFFMLYVALVIYFMANEW